MSSNKEAVYDPGKSPPSAQDNQTQQSLLIHDDDENTATPDAKESHMKGTKRRSLDGGTLIPMCTQAYCSLDNTDSYTFECKTCERQIHYHCTGLPLYQIQQFLTKNYRNYICQNCTNIPEYLSKAIPKPPSTLPTEEILSLKKVVSDKQQEVNVLAETNKLLNARITELTACVTKLEKNKKQDVNKLRDEKKRLDGRVKILENSEQTLQSLLDERENDLMESQKKLHLIEQHTDKAQQLYNTVGELKTKNDELESTLQDKEKKAVEEKSILNNQLNAQANIIEKLKNKVVNAVPKTELIKSGNISMEAMAELMTKKLERVEQNLKDSILKEVSNSNRILEDKMNEALRTHKNIANTVSVVPQETQVAAVNDFREIMKEQRDEQLAEESDQKLRACNIIIHGFQESSNSNSEEAKAHDTSLVMKLLEDIQLDIEFKTMFRLGKKNVSDSNERATRPLKVIMKNATDKDRVMANLSKLKGKEGYTRISITDDYSVKERNTIREWVNKAKDANAKEPDNSLYVWKARGSPKNRMVLKKFMKRNMDA